MKKEEFEIEIDRILEIENWRGYVTGKSEAALDLLYMLDLDLKKRVELYCRTVGVGYDTAFKTIEPRELEEIIHNNNDISYEDEKTLIDLISNKTMCSEEPMEHPEEQLKIISGVAKDKFIEESIPQVKIWIENGEDVSLKKVRDWILNKYCKNRIKEMEQLKDEIYNG